MKEFIGVCLVVVYERRHEVACIFVSLILVAALWVTLLAWTAPAASI